MQLSSILQQPLFATTLSSPSTGLLLMPAIEIPPQAADYVTVFRYKVKLIAARSAVGSRGVQAHQKNPMEDGL